MNIKTGIQLQAAGIRFMLDIEGFNVTEVKNSNNSIVSFAFQCVCALGFSLVVLYYEKVHLIL